MRRCTPKSFGDLWSAFKSDNPTVSYKIALGSIPDLWREELGDHTADQTTSIEFRYGTLTVHIASSVVRHQIFLARNSIRDRLNQRLGSEIIKNLIVR